MYGQEYEKELGYGCINLSNETEGKTNKLILRILAIILPSINISMSLAIAPWKAYFTFFTNWGVVATLITALFLTYCGSHGDSITQQKGKLACMHIIFEVAFAFNLIIVTVYWTVLHVHVIDDFEGASRLAMYLTHIFPAISLYFSWLSSENLYLSASHHILFLPIAIAYSILCLAHHSVNSSNKRCLYRMIHIN